MDTIEISSRSARACGCFRRLFFAIAVIGFSFNPVGASATAVPVKTELHEEVAHRVSATAFAVTFAPTGNFVRRHYDYIHSLRAIDIRVLQQLRIFKKCKINNVTQIRFRRQIYCIADDTTPSAIRSW